jgi:hypothetical protein
MSGMTFTTAYYVYIWDSSNVLGHPEFPVNPKILENLKVLAVVVSIDRTTELDAGGARTEFRGL